MGHRFGVKFLAGKASIKDRSKQYTHLRDPEIFPKLCNNMFASQVTNKVVNVTNNQLGHRMVSGKLRNDKRAACNHGVMDARGRLLSTKEA